MKTKRNFSEFIPAVIVTVLAYIAVAVFAFLRIATSTTVSSFNINKLEVGQVVNVTIVATKTLPADYDNPVSVEKGEKITKEGFPITEEQYAKLKKLAESPAYIDYRSLADSLLYLALLALLSCFLFSSMCLGHAAELKELILAAVFFVLIYGLTTFSVKTPAFSSPFMLGVIVPSSFCAMIIAILFGQKDAVFFSVIASFGVLNASNFELVPLLFTLATMLSGTRIVWGIQKRMDLVIASLLLSVLNVAFLMVLKVIFNESLTHDFISFAGVAFNGFFSGILVLGFLTPLELLLNTASVFRLMDLSDLNSPTMKKLLVAAGGTYNHSMMVASLAEAACSAIGANALLARVAAYYHDIGKMDQPEYFVENQSGHNIHNDINPSLSVSVIRSHVKKGVEKAHALHMPRQIIDIISEHHGNSVIAYFYNEAKEKDPSVSPEDFSYSGNPPSTRESAVVMLADTVEAACRTLEKPSVPRLEKFIQTLFNSKIEHHQLDNCALTFKDMDTIKQTFVQILAGYYHSRIEYPDQKDPDENKNVAEEKAPVQKIEVAQKPEEKPAEKPRASKTSDKAKEKK